LFLKVTKIKGSGKVAQDVIGKILTREGVIPGFTHVRRSIAAPRTHASKIDGK
jgi:hypothetical protein